jgi:Holliday junction resolvase-like predicted endonuclease
MMHARHLKGIVSHQLATLWLAEKGYIVFDNVYKVGPVDLVALKDNKVHLFDVKSVKRYSDNVKIKKLRGKLIYRIKNDRQKQMGVKLLYVEDTGECKIV